jgi:hypothetical protein
MEASMKYLFIMGILISCGRKHHKDAPLAPIVSIYEFINHTSAERDRNERALKKMRDTIRGQCFRDKLLARKMSQTEGKSNAEILNDLLMGNVTMRLKMYRNNFTRTISYTYPDTDMIWLNRSFYDDYTTCNIASNFAHEAAHKLGYGHDFELDTLELDEANLHDAWSSTVPYSVGILVGKCCED